MTQQPGAQQRGLAGAQKTGDDGDRQSARQRIDFLATCERRLPPSQRHLEDIEAAREPIDRVDDLPLVDIDVVELDGAGPREHGRPGMK